jgi:tetratricopeptide (TPR) repeat protein
MKIHNIFKLFLASGICLYSALLHADNCPEALKLLNTVSRNDGYAPDTEKIFLKIEKECPSLIEAQYEFGKFYLSQGKYQEAISRFRKADALKPRIEHLLGIAKGEILLKKYNDAEDTYKDAIARYSGHWRSLEGLGTLFLTIGRFQEAEELFNQALQEQSNADTVYYNLGVALERQGRVDEALVSYRTALLKNNRLKPARIALIRRSLDTGKLADAKRYLEEGILLYPKDVPILLLQVELLQMYGDFDDALTLLDRILLLDPGLSNRSLQGIIHIKNNDVKEGIAILEGLYAENQKDPDVQRAYVWGLIKMKKYSDAENLLLKIIADDPEDPVSLNNLGVLYEETGKINEAREAYRKAGLLLPHSETIQFNHNRVQ